MNSGVLFDLPEKFICETFLRSGGQNVRICHFISANISEAIFISSISYLIGEFCLFVELNKFKSKRRERERDGMKREKVSVGMF